ncbi:MAG: methyltransferase domain-containing protein [Deltaproteobacteria bacterium]|nr:MAG: methyltransferase domain-containing protein [Deltaproteobacteria bacterium]
MPDPWDPRQYDRFRTERAQPFRDLLALVQPRPGMRVVDLGCGTGDMTLELHRELGARETLGIDDSASMLAKVPRAEGLRFEQLDIAKFAPAEPFDLAFSNAALHWVPDHPSLLRRLTRALRPGGQLAIQMPMNDDHPSHQTAFELARSPEFRRLLHGFERRAELLEPAQYSSWLHKLGFVRQQVRLQIYAHLLESREQVIEWVRGALLTDYQKRLAPADWERFLRRYRELLLPQLDDERPFLYTYPRILIWGELP